jgi:hypothetical protein
LVYLAGYWVVYLWLAIGGLAFGSVGLVIPGNIGSWCFLLFGFIDHDHTAFRAEGCGTIREFRKSFGYLYSLIITLQKVLLQKMLGT